MKNILYIVYTIFIASFLFVTLDVSQAETILGDIKLVDANGKTDIYPIISGDNIKYNRPGMIRVSGAALIVDEDANIKVTGHNGNVVFNIENGVVNFRVQPHKSIVYFKTMHGDFQSPGIVKASTSRVEGVIAVDEKETTLKLSEGALKAYTREGTKNVYEGDEIIMTAQAVLEENGDTEEIVTDNTDKETVPEEGIDNNLLGAVVFGGASATAITTTVILASRNGGDGPASRIE